MNRLDRRVQLVWVVRWLVAAVAFAALTAVLRPLLVGRFDLPLPAWTPVAVAVALAALGVVLTVARYRLWRFEVREDALYLERGVFTRVYTVVPFVRIQHVDAQRGPLERLLGLSSTVVYTAGSRGADVTVPGLPPADADELQDRLKRLAIRAEGEDAV